MTFEKNRRVCVVIAKNNFHKANNSFSLLFRRHRQQHGKKANKTAANCLFPLQNGKSASFYEEILLSIRPEFNALISQ